ncbi:MAG: tetratricopeptide repeat protein, partial [Planctomycetes bacterium]|nr:tetratricopeptide repeat protein [Planctomycetota bacterium]
LAILYQKQERYDQAESLNIKTLEVRRRVLGEEHPDTLRSMNSLAWMLATCPVAEVRDGTKAVENATQLCEVTNWENHSYLDTLAAAYAETKDFTAAVKWQQKAIELLPGNEPPESRAEYEARIKLYQAGQPFHEIKW